MAERIIVIDDDPVILKEALRSLKGAGMKTVALKSGEQLLEYISQNESPELILLDIKMPGMDGFETLIRLRKMENKGNETPVIFLTGQEDEEAEIRGLLLGAMDFISGVLNLRVRHAVELIKLQKNLAKEVEKKTKENEELFLQVVASLADAIDAKDAYTKGHSGRVAAYAREIARRCGYDEAQLDAVYMMGLLHDVGKIGVPDNIINKTGRLTDEEFAKIKKHPEIGGRILENIQKMPELVCGAKWHHERFDGKGYPDGLSGFDIPETARIIAVADAYDAMTSNRSYRNVLPQAKVRAEIEEGMGRQFDPRFAGIMLEMIDEDKDYTMRDRPD
ncbi:HD domain-containing phosphohydrolase [Butyrivibrio sp. NC3005]|uniref:HD domain-containing phosphohydrolase n=1 Tax=Butyrivibrio sp. NC3005 TaxID=1280685 RepID=UPI0004296F8D|nr:HD domain-containing phosphohydrolase [Butyrivibrio sp. NC3005]